MLLQEQEPGTAHACLPSAGRIGAAQFPLARGL